MRLHAVVPVFRVRVSHFHALASHLTTVGCRSSLHVLWFLASVDRPQRFYPAALLSLLFFLRSLGTACSPGATSNPPFGAVGPSAHNYRLRCCWRGERRLGRHSTLGRLAQGRRDLRSRLAVRSPASVAVGGATGGLGSDRPDGDARTVWVSISDEVQNAGRD